MGKLSKKHGMKMTDGVINLVGKVTGVKRENFYSEKTTFSGKEKRIVKFGIETSPNNTIYVQMEGQQKDNVFFFRKEDKEKGYEKETKIIAWNERNKFNEDGFGIIGTTIGIEKELDEKGKEKNLSKTLIELDACEYINELSKSGKFKDGMEIRVLGNIDYSSFTGRDGDLIRFKKLMPNKIYNSRVDFEAEDFVEENCFSQEMVFKSIEIKTDEDGKKYGLISGYSINYFGAEEIELKTYNQKLARNMMKRLKEYSFIKVHGSLENRMQEVEVVETSDDDWGGEENPMDKSFKNPPRRLEFIVKGIDTKNIDTTSYNKEKLDELLKPDEDFGKNETSDDDWGGEEGKDFEDDDDDWG